MTSIGQQFLAGLKDGIRRGLIASLEKAPFALLFFGHPAFASQNRGMETQHKLTIGSDQKVEVIGMVLAEGKGLETIENQRLGQAKVFEALGLESQGLAAEANMTIGQESGRNTEGAATLTKP